jgi:hypothetical protein
MSIQDESRSWFGRLSRTGVLVVTVLILTATVAIFSLCACKSVP